MVVYHYLLVFFLIYTVRKRSCGRLVDYTSYVKSCDLSCVLGCLTLCVGEVCRYGDNCFGYLLAQIALSVSLQLLEYHSRDLLRSVLLAAHSSLVIAAHVALDGNYGVLVVCNSLSFSYLTYQSFACLGNAYY